MSKDEKITTQAIDHTKDEWIAITAHQLRTGLTTNKWILKMFLDQDFGTLLPEQQTFLKKAYDETEHMIQTVKVMLDTYRSNTPELPYTMQPTSIESLIENVLFMFNAESYKENVELLFLKPSKPLPLIIMDQDKIRIVLENIIENSIKYSNKSDKVIIATYLTETSVGITIKDTGIGIPKNEQAQICSKGYRATNAQAHSTGTGLGLYMSKQIVDKHKGVLKLESEENTGTTVTLEFPLVYTQ